MIETYDCVKAPQLLYIIGQEIQPPVISPTMQEPVESVSRAPVGPPLFPPTQGLPRASAGNHQQPTTFSFSSRAEPSTISSPSTFV